jgi:hypothetical protein
MGFNFTVEHRAGRAHSNVDPLSCNLGATLPWEIEAGKLDDFPKSAAPEFQTQDPPAHPIVQVVSTVNEDVDSSEGIGNGAVTNAEPRTPEGETSQHSATPVDAPSKAREGSPIMRQGRRLHPKRLFSRGGQQGRSTHDPWGANGAHLVTSARSPLGAMEMLHTCFQRNPRNTDIPPYSRHFWSWDTWRKSKKAYLRGEDRPAQEAETRTRSAHWRWSAEHGQGKRNTSNLCSRTASFIAANNEARNLFWHLFVELVKANRHGQEGCKLHHHDVWTDTDNEDNEQPRGLTVRMIRSPMGLPGPPAPDIEEEGGAQEEPAPVKADEVLGDDWDDHLGWNAEANIAAAEGPASSEDVLTNPRIDRGLKDSELLNAVHELKRQMRFKSNGGEKPSLAAPSLVKRVAIAILHDKPERDPKEVLQEVKRSVLNLRLEYRENVERVLKENLAMHEEKEEGNSEGIPLETRLDAFELTPTPEPQDYLVDNDEVVAYLFRGELPVFADLSTNKRKEARDKYEIEQRSFELTTADSSSSTSCPSDQIRFWE